MKLHQDAKRWHYAVSGCQNTLLILATFARCVSMSIREEGEDGGRGGFPGVEMRGLTPEPVLRRPHCRVEDSPEGLRWGSRFRRQ